MIFKSDFQEFSDFFIPDCGWNGKIERGGELFLFDRKGSVCYIYQKKKKMMKGDVMRKFILDTDWWTDCDDAVGIRLLCNAHVQKEIELLGIHVNACMEYSIPALDVFTRDCGVEVPLGLDHQAVDFEGEPSYQKHLAEVRQVLRYNKDVPGSLDFYLELLEKAEDNSVEILSIGFTQALAALLKDPKGRALVSQKVTHLWIMAGKWDEDRGLEYNFYKNELTRRSGAELCAGWPTPITFLGWEAGHTVLSGGKLPDGDLLKQVMQDHGSPKGRSSWDPMTILLAVTGVPEEAGYRCVYGKASVDPKDGSNMFSENPAGPHRYVVKLFEDTYYADAIDSRLLRTQK